MLFKPVAFFSFLFLLLFTWYTPSQTITYKDNAYPQGLTLQKSSTNSVSFTFSVSSFDLTDVTVGGKERKAVHMPLVFLPNEAGYPDVPALSTTIAVPKGARVVLHYNSSKKAALENIDIAPAPVLPKENESGDLQYEENRMVYSANAFYPASPVQISDVTEMRGLDVVMLSVAPFQYNPVTKQLLVHKDISVEVQFDGGNGTFGDERLRSIWWEPVYQQNIINYASLEPCQPKKHNSKSLTPDYEYLIITPDNPVFLAWADTLKNWRTRQGIRTGVVTLTTIGGNDTTKIRNYIKTAYTTWAIPPVAVLFLGDYSTGATTGNGINSPIYNAYCASDNKFVDMNYDHLPDLATGRISAQDNTQLQTIIGKMLTYERNPPMSIDFYKKPIIAGGWQTERWFILCTDVIYGYLKNKQGKTPTREYAIYSGTPSTSWSSNQNTSTVVNFFGPNGLNYIPATPAHLTDWGGNATRINADINAGAFILQHRDHGMETGWGEPSYTSSNVATLNNSMLPFVFSLNCLTGKFNYSSNCFAEAFTRHAKGALGVIGASEVSYSFVNDAYTWGMYDFMFPDFHPTYGETTDINLLPAFANASGKYFLKASSWPYNTGDKLVTYHLFHHFGDVFMRVNSEIPKTIIVTRDTAIQAGDNSYCLSATPGALICISKNGQIIETALATASSNCMYIGNPQPDEVYELTITKQNYLRYSALVRVYGEPQPAHVTYPNGGEVLRVGTTKTLRWQSTLTGNLKLEYSLNNGATWMVIADSVPAASLSYAWVVPNTPSDSCKFRVCDCQNPLVSDVSDFMFSITGQYCAEVTLVPDWNLVSVPVAAMNMSAATLFPAANSAVYGFNGAYQAMSTLANGAGYWLRTATGAVQTHCGEPVATDTIYLNAGWNIIGGFHQAVPTTALASSLPNNIQSSYFGYNNGYAVQTVLTPGKGYWVRAQQQGTLVITHNKAPEKAENTEHSFTSKITITDNTGKSQSLYLVNNQPGNAFQLPPAPPTGVFDVRFSSGMYAVNSSEAGSIEISGAAYPLTVSVEGSPVMLSDAVTSGKIFQSALQAGMPVHVTNKEITQLQVMSTGKQLSYQLLQNYPNPFNPETEISFVVPEKAHVTITVFNQLGQEVAVLFNGEKEAGFHHLTWNASAQATGVYFYSIKTPAFSAVKKLILMK